MDTRKKTKTRFPFFIEKYLRLQGKESTLAASGYCFQKRIVTGMFNGAFCRIWLYHWLLRRY
jgi:hypothetical protein